MPPKPSKREQELLNKIQHLEARIKTLEDDKQRLTQDKKEIRKDKDLFATLALDNAKTLELCMSLINDLIRKVY